MDLLKKKSKIAQMQCLQSYADKQKTECISAQPGNKLHLTSQKPRRSLAFTLAETLVTLMIIGVVSALVIPGVISDFQEHEFKSKYKKLFSTLSNALQRANADKSYVVYMTGGGSGWDLSLLGQYQYLNYARVCTDADKCWTQDTIRGLNNADTSSDFSLDEAKDSSAKILADGVVISDWIIMSSGSNYARIYILIDLNGKQKPNVVGMDIHKLVFEVTSPAAEPKVIPWYSNNPNVSGVYNKAAIDAGCQGRGISDVSNTGYTCGAKWITNP